MKRQPNINDMTEKKRKEWEQKLQEMESDNTKKDAFNKIKGGRGWIF